MHLIGAAEQRDRDSQPKLVEWGLPTDLLHCGRGLLLALPRRAGMSRLESAIGQWTGLDMLAAGISGLGPTQTT
jgi:hypothetical protein